MILEERENHFHFFVTSAINFHYPGNLLQSLRLATKERNNRRFWAREIFWNKGKTFSHTSPECLQSGLGPGAILGKLGQILGKKGFFSLFLARSMARRVL
jgi:hypothetical protein